MSDYRYKNYTKARNAAWELLIEADIKELPVDVFGLAKKLRIRIRTYKESRLLLRVLGLSRVAEEKEGLAVSFLGRKYIFYNDEITSEGRKRFTVAHEIGHFRLKHFKRSGFFKVKCAQRGGGTAAREREANAFAARLLAPACILAGVEVKTTEDVMKLCGMSRQAAEYRLERLQILKGRDMFGFNEREAKVYKNFEEFINKNKRTD